MGGEEVVEVRKNYSESKANQTPPQLTKFSPSQSKGSIPEASKLCNFYKFQVLCIFYKAKIIYNRSPMREVNLYFTEKEN